MRGPLCLDMMLGTGDAHASWAEGAPSNGRFLQASDKVKVQDYGTRGSAGILWLVCRLGGGRGRRDPRVCEAIQPRDQSTLGDAT